MKQKRSLNLPSLKKAFEATIEDGLEKMSEEAKEKATGKEEGSMSRNRRRS